MKQIMSAKEIMARIKANTKSVSYDWVVDLISETSLKMYNNLSSSSEIAVPEMKKREFGRLIHTAEVRNILNSHDFMITETDYGTFYLSCKNR